MSAKKPPQTSDEEFLDVRALMEEIQQTAKHISAFEGGGLPQSMSAPLPPPPRALDDDWDVWRTRPVRSHRGLLGLPIVMLKRASLLLLRLHDRELLKGQREFNRAVREELRQLREHVTRAAAPRPPPSRESKD